jgi:hypothetical protein
MQMLADSREDLAKIVTEVNAVIASAMPELFKTLAANNLQPGPIKPLRAIGTPSPQK